MDEAYYLVEKLYGQ